jgi:hypothetical protein
MYMLKNSLIILILILLINVSCIKSEKDLSLTAAEYHKMGIPDQNKLSSNQDYLKVLTTLNRIKIKDPLSFPRKHSKKSGDVFKCLINKENLSFVNDTTISLHDRALQIQFLSSLQNTELQLYTDKLKSEQYYNEELIDLYIYTLFVRKKMFELAGKINNSKAESDISMQAGQLVVVNGYMTMIISILEEQVKSRGYLRKDLDRLSMEVSESIIENLNWIEPADRQKISIELKNTIEQSPSNYVKDNYRKVLKALEGAN